MLKNTEQNIDERLAEQYLEHQSEFNTWMQAMIRSDRRNIEEEQAQAVAVMNARK